MPEEILETSQPTEAKSFNWRRVILALVLSTSLSALAAYIGYWYGMESARSKQISRRWAASQDQDQPTISSRSLIPSPDELPTYADYEPPPFPWATYTNTKYGYSIDYLRDWVKTEEGANYVRFFEGPYEEGAPISETYISVSIEENPGDLPLEDWLEENPPQYGGAENTVVDGQPAIKYTSSGPVGEGSILVYSKKGENIYKLALILMGSDTEEAGWVFDHMLSTFKFFN